MIEPRASEEALHGFPPELAVITEFFGKACRTRLKHRALGLAGC